MADFYSHAKLAEEVTKLLGIDVMENLLFLGAQGPDPFYYKFLGKDSTTYSYYADRMHDTDTQQLFLNMIDYVKENNTKETYSFLVGFICHYALDINIHPYVYYNVGVVDKDDPSTNIYRGLHLKFERSIDAVLVKRDLGIRPNLIAFTKKYFPQKVAPLAIMQVMDHVLNTTYQKEHGGVMYLIAVQQMYRNLKHMVKDRFGIKKAFFKFIDLFHKNDLFIQDVSFYNHIEPYDFLNLNHETWHHPITNQPSTKSVLDLYEDAVTDAKRMVQEVTDYLFEDKAVDLKALFTNLSFNSGMDCDHKEPMKYFSIYRK